MENPLANLFLKGSSVLACILLVLAAGLVLSAHLGYTENYTPGVITVVFATITGVVSIAFLNISNGRQRSEIRTTIEQAYRLSNGEYFEDTPTSEIGDALRSASDYLH